MVVHICNPAFGKLSQENREFETIELHREFQASFGLHCKTEKAETATNQWS